MKISGIALILTIILAMGVLFLVGGYRWLCSSRAEFTFNNSEYQYSNPDVSREWYYYKCLADECNGDTNDYYCLQKCHLKSYRLNMDTVDIKDWICYPYIGDEDAFYKCLADTYSDYKYP